MKITFYTNARQFDSRPSMSARTWLRAAADDENNTTVAKRLRRVCCRSNLAFVFHMEIKTGSGSFVNRYDRGLFACLAIQDLTLHTNHEDMKSASVEDVASSRLFLEKSRIWTFFDTFFVSLYVL